MNRSPSEHPSSNQKRVQTLKDLHASRMRLSVGQIDFLFEEIERLRRFERMFQEATTVLGDKEVLQYVTSGNSIPVTRCTVSADLIRQLVEGRRAASEPSASLGDEDGPGEEDGPWAEGWEQRRSQPPDDGPDGLLHKLEVLRQAWSHNHEFENAIGNCMLRIEAFTTRRPETKTRHPGVEVVNQGEAAARRDCSEGTTHE